MTAAEYTTLADDGCPHCPGHYGDPPDLDAVFDRLTRAFRARAEGSRTAYNASAAGFEPDDLVQFALLGAWESLPRAAPVVNSPMLFVWLLARGTGEMASAVRERGYYSRTAWVRLAKEGFAGGGRVVQRTHRPHPAMTAAEAFRHEAGDPRFNAAAPPPWAALDRPADLFAALTRRAALTGQERAALRGWLVDGLTHLEQGRRLGVSESRVSQVCGAAVRRVRESLAAHGLTRADFA